MARAPIKYRGFRALIEFDHDDDIFVGRIAGVDDVIGFHADTISDLKIAFREAVEDYLATRAFIAKPSRRP